jgi:Ca2+/H+ antiporter, TMEM165/GDT1 family
MKQGMFRKPSGPKRVIFFLLIGATALLFFGSLVMLLWNAVLPPLIHVGEIGFWQSLGLLLLCKILFTPFGAGRRRPVVGYGGALKEKLMSMSEEEKASFREQWKNRCKENKG